MHTTSNHQLPGMCIINPPTNDTSEQQHSLPTKKIDQTLKQPQLKCDSFAPLQR